jgi:pimeloyl-ACP methyl ester carboxylesterase
VFQGLSPAACTGFEAGISQSVKLLNYEVGRLGFDYRQGYGIFLSAFRPALGPTQSPTQWVVEAISLGVKRERREGDHLPPSSVETMNAWSYTSTPPIRLHGLVLTSGQDTSSWCGT